MADNLSLLQHTLNRFGVVTVMDVQLQDCLTKEPVLELDTLKISNITTDGSTKEIRGGMSADLLLTYSHSRTVNVEITDALLSLYSLQRMWGGVLNSGSIKFHNSIKTTLGTTGKLIVKTDDSVVVDPEVAEGDVELVGYNLINPADDPEAYLHIYDVDGDHKFTSEQVTATWKAGYVTFDFSQYWASGGSKNKKVSIYALDVAEPDETTGFNPVEVILRSTSFPDRVTLVGKTVYLDERSGKQILGQIEIPRFQFGNTFDISMDAEGDAATFNFSGMALVDADTKDIIKLKNLKLGVNILDE